MMRVLKDFFRNPVIGKFHLKNLKEMSPFYVKLILLFLGTLRGGKIIFK